MVFVVIMSQNGRRTGGKRHLTNVPQERNIKENKNGAARTATVSPFNFANYRSSRSVCEAGAAISVSSFYRCFRWRIRHRSKSRTRRLLQSVLQSSASASPSFHSISAQRRIMLKRVTHCRCTKLVRNLAKCAAWLARNAPTAHPACRRISAHAHATV